MTGRRQTRAVVTVIVLVLIGVALGVRAARAAETLLSEPSLRRDATTSWTVGTSQVAGLACDYRIESRNDEQRSIHHGNQLTVDIDGALILALAIEDTTDPVWSQTSAVAGQQVTVTLHVLAADGLSSAGFVLTQECEAPPSSIPPTTAGSTTTTEPPPPETATTTTTTTTPESSTTTSLAAPPTVPSSPPSTAPSTTAPAPIPIPSGVPTGEGPAPPALWPGLFLSTVGVAALAILGGLAWRRR